MLPPSQRHIFLTLLHTVFYLAAGVAQTYMTFRYGAKYMLCMVVATYTYAIGLALRYGLHSHPDDQHLYIAENILTIISTCGIAIANCMILERLCRWLKGDDHLWMRPNRLTAIFVTSDICTFLVQGVGGGLSVTGNADRAALGQNLSLTGLIAQLLSFSVFTSMSIRFLYRVRKHEPYLWLRQDRLPFLRDWRGLAYALCLSSAGVLVRSFYRITELSEGYQGYLATNEKYFYALEALPLLISASVFIPFWPGRFIPSTEELKVSKSAMELVSTTASGRGLLRSIR
ncbi:RTA1-like protein [Panus rudis PR-1116 ss-1]|nr:RTA1-like protein [Panus rudis PR-1116 ss-1]